MRIGFIGAGNMGTPMIKSIIRAGIVPAGNITVNDRDRSRLALLKEETGILPAQTNREVVEASDIILLAVKPNVVKVVLEECNGCFDERKILITIVAGLPLKLYKEILGTNRKIIRTMPNTPAMVGEGMTVISYDSVLTEADLKAVMPIFESFGKVEVLEEKLMSEVIALSGSSPAYVFMFIEAMADAAVLSGIPRGLAYKLAAQTVLGSAKMVLETGKHPGELKDQVCSPAGTTIEAVASLEKNGFRSAIIEAMSECTKKARELGKQYGS
jgi:pyrroline-5-carboxylate reductase